jgi:hypothetical protein
LPLQEKGTVLEFPSPESSKQDQLGLPHINPTQFGLAGEALVKYLLHMWDYSMCTPLDTSASFDLLVKGEKDWVTVQVKHSTRENVKLKRNKHENGKPISDPYKQGDFDYLFVCRFPHIYIVPFSHIKTITCFTFNMYKAYRHDLMDQRTYVNKPILTKEENERVIN